MKRISDFKTKIIVFIIVSLYALVLYFTSLECPFYTIFRLPCPGCGMTRAWISVFKFDLAKAFSYHKMFWALPLMLVAFLRDGGIFKNKKLNILLFLFIVAGFMINWAENLTNKAFL